MTKIFLVAGEESGDIHAANMIRQLRKLADFSLYGTGGHRLKDLGQEQYFDISQMTIIGLNEVLEKLPFIFKMFKTLKQKLLEVNPDLVILVDYPGFNLRFAEFAKSKGFKVLYYIAPQVWAWHYSRVYKMRNCIDFLYCILPFEEEIFKKEGLNALYVGNPIIDNIKLKFDSKIMFNSKFGLDLDKPTIGLLPGSRKKEILNTLPIFMETVKRLSGKYNFILAQADSVADDLFRCVDKNVKIVKGFNYDVMRYSDILWCCSGTASLEAAFLGTPPIIVYKAPLFTEFVGRYIFKIKRIGLPNIVFDENIFPELFNRDFNPESLMTWTERILTDKDSYIQRIPFLQNLFKDKNPSVITAEHIKKNFLP